MAAPPPPSTTRLGTQYGLIRASGGEKQRDGGTRFRKVAASAAASYHFFCQLIFRHGSEPVKRSVERGPSGASYGGHSSASTNETGISSHDSLFYRFSSHGSTLFRLIRRNIITPLPQAIGEAPLFFFLFKKITPRYNDIIVNYVSA